MADCCPSRTELNLANTGGGQFSIAFSSAGERLYFPFASTPIDALTYTGTAGVRTATYDDPMLGGATGTTAARMIGKPVVVSYTSAEGHRVYKAEGTLNQADTDIVVVAGDDGATTTTLKTDNILSVAVKGLAGEPTLVTQLANPGGSVVVRGRDSQFSYTVQHSLLVEPDVNSQDGSCKVRLSTHATVHNGYNWPLELAKLTLTEHEIIERPMHTYARAQTSAYQEESAAAAPSSGGGGGTSGQSGAVEVPGAIRLARTLAPTVVTVGVKELTKAKWHLLGSADPATSVGKHQVELDFVVRLNRAADDGFLLSGSAAVQLDMDPVAGDDHVAPVSLPFGFHYNAWDTTNSKRMYYRLGSTTLVALEMSSPGDLAKHDKHDVQENNHVVHRRLKYANKTPYPAVTKVYLRTESGRMVLKDVKLMSDYAKDAVSLGNFVPETKEMHNEPTTRTLVVRVPPNTREFVVDLRTEYVTQTFMRP